MFESNHQLEKKATLTNGSTNAEQQLQQDDECLRNLVRHCELKYNANLEARVKFQSEPLRFMSSELELFSALADFSATISRCSSEEDDEDEDKLQQNVFATLASHSSQQLLQILCGLEHDNLDIKKQFLIILRKIVSSPYFIVENDSAKKLNSIISNTSLVEKSFDLLKSLSAETKSEESIMLDIIDIIIKLFEFSDDSAAKIIGIPQDPTIDSSKISEIISYSLKFLKHRVKKFSTLYLYITELLVAFGHNKLYKKYFDHPKMIFIIMSRMAEYKSSIPSLMEEMEYLENLISILCSMLDSAENQQIFADQDGISLLLILLDPRQKPKFSVLKILITILSNSPQTNIIEMFFDNGGVGIIFSILKIKCSKGKQQISQSEKDEMILEVICLLFDHCKDTYLLRLMMKFSEKSFEYSEHLIETFIDTYKLVEEQRKQQTLELQDKFQQLEMMKNLNYLDMLECGLGFLQTVSRIIWYLLFMNRDTSDFIVKIFRRQNLELRIIEKIISEWFSEFEENSLNSDAFEFFESSLAKFDKLFLTNNK